MNTYGSNEFVSVRDRLKSLRENGTLYTTDNPEYWANKMMGGVHTVSDAPSKYKKPDVPDWLQNL